MHSAPSVQYPVGPCRFQARVLGALWLAAAAACGAWAWSAPASVERRMLALGVLMASGGLSWRSWQATPSGQLAWDGAAWQWTPGGNADAQPGAVQVRWHGQHCLLLQFMPHRAVQAWHGGRWTGSIWLWLESSAAPGRWLDLRRAVYSRPGATSSAPSPG